jgi:predicted ribosome quality control (RQC) complex YloA/Tae2 family protein
MVNAIEKELTTYSTKLNIAKSFQPLFTSSSETNSQSLTYSLRLPELEASLKQLLEFRELVITNGYLVETNEQTAAKKAKQTSSQETKRPDRWKYGKNIEVFRSPNGFEVIAGRSALCNEEVSN